MSLPINISDDLRIGADGASSAWMNGVQVWPSGPYHLGTPVLIYTYTGSYFPVKAVPSGTGTILLGFGDPSGAPTDGFIEELDLDGTDLGLFDSYTRAPHGALGTLGTDVYVANEGAHEVRKNNVSWASLATYSADFNDTPWLTVDQDDGTVWVTAAFRYLYEISTSAVVTRRDQGSSSRRFRGLTAVDGVVYVCDSASVSVFSYTPGVGFAFFASVAAIGEADTWDVTYSPLTDRFYATIHFAATGASYVKVISFARSDPTDLVVELYAADLSSGQFNPLGVTYIAGALYVVDATTKKVWRVPFET